MGSFFVNGLRQSLLYGDLPVSLKTFYSYTPLLLSLRFRDSSLYYNSVPLVNNNNNMSCHLYSSVIL